MADRSWLGMSGRKRGWRTGRDRRTIVGFVQHFSAMALIVGIACHGLTWHCQLAAAQDKPTVPRASAADRPKVAPAEPMPPPAIDFPERLDGSRIENLFWVNPRLYSGGGPEKDADFAELAKLGIKVIVSVDGAEPNVELARRHGLRYIHIPIGYDKLDASQQKQLAKVAQEAKGPVYVHCHHGKHRGPAAAALVWRSMEPKCTAEETLTWLKKAGTDPKYVGLYATVRDFQRVADEELAGEAVKLVERVKPQGWTEAMVAWDHLADPISAAQKKGWPAPRTEAIHNLTQLVEAFREGERLAEREQRPADFREWLRKGAKESEQLRRQLDRVIATEATLESKHKAEWDEGWKRVTAACADCHVKYRDR